MRTQLPVEGVEMILGNDLAGTKVFPYPIVSAEPDVSGQDVLSQFPSLLPSCAVTRAQKKFADVLDLSSLFFGSSPESSECKLPIQPQLSQGDEYLKEKNAPLKVGREQLMAAQKSDVSLNQCVSAAADQRKFQMRQ